MTSSSWGWSFLCIRNQNWNPCVSHILGTIFLFKLTDIKLCGCCLWSRDWAQIEQQLLFEASPRSIVLETAPNRPTVGASALRFSCKRCGWRLVFSSLNIWISSEVRRMILIWWQLLWPEGLRGLQHISKINSDWGILGLIMWWKVFEEDLQFVLKSF